MAGAMWWSNHVWKSFVVKVQKFSKQKKNDNNKSLECLGKCHNCGKLGHWANSCLEPKKPRVDKGSNSRIKLARSHIKGKEVQQPEFEEVNVVEGEEAKEDEFKIMWILLRE